MTALRLTLKDGLVLERYQREDEARDYIVMSWTHKSEQHHLRDYADELLSAMQRAARTSERVAIALRYQLAVYASGAMQVFLKGQPTAATIVAPEDVDRVHAWLLDPELHSDDEQVTTVEQLTESTIEFLSRSPVVRYDTVQVVINGRPGGESASEADPESECPCDVCVARRKAAN